MLAGLRLFDFQTQPTATRSLTDVVIAPAGLVKPGAYPGSHHKVFFGQEEILLPIYGTIQRAVQAQPNADVFINYASSRFAT